MYALFAVVTAALLCACHQQMGEVGNGGHGVRIADKVFLVDLVEAGEHLSQEQPPKSEVPFQGMFHGKLRLQNQREGEDLGVRAAVDRLERIHLVDPLLALSLAQAMSLYEWKVIDSELRGLTLVGQILPFRQSDLVLAANRRGRTIYLSRPVLEKMDDKNRGALILHEAVYSLLALNAENRQDPVRVREIVGYLYSKGAEFSDFLVAGEIPFGGRAAFLDSLVPHKANRGVLILEPQLLIHKLGETMHRPIAAVFDREMAREMCGHGKDQKFALHLRSRTHKVLRFQLAAYNDLGENKTFVQVQEDAAPGWKLHAAMQHPSSWSMEVAPLARVPRIAELGDDDPCVETLMADVLGAQLRVQPVVNGTFAGREFKSALQLASDRMGAEFVWLKPSGNGENRNEKE